VSTPMSMLDSTLSATIEIQLKAILSWIGPSLEGVVMKSETASPCECQRVTHYSEVPAIISVFDSPSIRTRMANGRRFCGEKKDLFVGRISDHSEDCCSCFRGCPLLRHALQPVHLICRRRPRPQDLRPKTAKRELPRTPRRHL
jgi:hypothetical protein